MYAVCGVTRTVSFFLCFLLTRDHPRQPSLPPARLRVGSAVPAACNRRFPPRPSAPRNRGTPGMGSFCKMRSCCQSSFLYLLLCRSGFFPVPAQGEKGPAPSNPAKGRCPLDTRATSAANRIRLESPCVCNRETAPPPKSTPGTRPNPPHAKTPSRNVPSCPAISATAQRKIDR